MKEERSAAAAERILDAAEQLFLDRGIEATGMADIARAAGCSRATLYRYFDSRRALHLAFVHREARRVGEEVARGIEGVAPDAVLVEAMTRAIALVRARPTLAAWFRLGEAGIAAEIAQSSEVIEALGVAFLGRAGLASDDLRMVARWIVRIIVSLLTVPEGSPDEERALIERFVAPVVPAQAIRNTG
ncbi:TetR/AcrR family transcriptional regulator [Skermania sp. ID1734]|uniref:TetR/AcrR family transcriptional regulator n=1 Tax=Skermania sp. ID1734 TaxID=2597516 RepID=UPI002104892D|nr:TetR/AcrR family transcriptional regulator [Skermania sp. ID1734]